MKAEKKWELALEKIEERLPLAWSSFRAVEEIMALGHKLYMYPFSPEEKSRVVERLNEFARKLSPAGNEADTFIYLTELKQYISRKKEG